MDKIKIKGKLEEIFRDVFDDDEIIVFNEMTADDVEDWDSLSHINLIHDIEISFGIKFTTKEIISAQNVGEFIEIIERKTEK